MFELRECKFCSYEVEGDETVCPMCGAPLPAKQRVVKPPPSAPVQQPVKRGARPLVVVAALAATMAVLLIALNLMRAPTRAPEIAPRPESGLPSEPAAKTPEDVFSGTGYKQMLELIFGKELHRIAWEEIDQIEGLRLSGENVGYRLQGEEDFSWILLDTRLSDLRPLGSLGGLRQLITAQDVNRETLELLTGLEELEASLASPMTDLSAFSCLPNLKRLGLSGSNLTSLKGITDLPGLESLRLSSTGISDLSILSGQHNIKELAFIDNRELGSLNSIEQMVWLTALHIERCENFNLAFIKNITELEHLTLSRTDTKSVDFLTELTKLRSLTLTQNDNLMEIPSLAGMTQLEELVVNCSKVKDPTFLTGLTSVRKMQLISPDSLEPIRGFQNLEELSLSFGWLLSDVSPLGDLSALKTLKIYDSNTYHQIQGMSAIGNLKGLEVLDLTECEIFFDGDFIYTLPNLVELRLSGNIVVGDFAGIGNLRNLKRLYLDKVHLSSYFRIVNNGGFVDIYYSDPIPLESYSDALSRLIALEELYIDRNKVEEIGFAAGMENLRILSAEDNYIKDVSPLSDPKHLTFVNLAKNPVSNWEAVSEQVNTTFLGR